MFYVFDDEDGDVNVAFISEEAIMMLLVREMLQTAMRRRRLLNARRPPPADPFMRGWSQKALTGPNSKPTTLQSPISAKLAPYFNQNDGHHADVVIGARGETPLYAHKVILSSWSSRLKKMILQKELKMNASQSSSKGAHMSENLLHIETLEEDGCDVAFSDFLQYMYTETITLSLQTVWAHIMLAVKYNVKELLFTCSEFVFTRVSEMTIGPGLKELMSSVRKHHCTKAVIQVTMQRTISELFMHEDDAVMYLDIDLLCDVLRSSSVVAISEFDIFLKLKPKLDALKESGEHRQVLRLLSLIRLTQMTSTELKEVVSSEYMDEMRRAFPGKLDTALWIRALYSEQSWDEIPMNVEQTRLYFENPAVKNNRLIHRSGGTGDRVESQDEVQPVIKLGDIVMSVKEGEQRIKVNKNNRNRATVQFPVYKVSTVHYGVVKHSSEWTLELPQGKFPAVTMYLIRPRRVETVDSKIVLALYKTIQGQLDPKPTVICYEGKEFVGYRKECIVDSLPTTDEMDISVRVVGYAYDRGRSQFHQVVNPTRSWWLIRDQSEPEECLGAASKVTTSDDGKSSKRKPNWVKQSKKKKKTNRKRKGCWW